ncbi:MAG TPA: hypothetical protein VI299_06350 [Polyangiales bacterium]
MLVVPLFPRRLMRRVLALALVIAAALPLACGRELFESDVFAEPDLSGNVRIPLSATAEDGTLYVLRGATFEISGAAMLTLNAPSDLSEPERALSTPLPAGAYTLYLRPGYQLFEITPSGEQRKLDLALAGDNPQRFALREVQDATVRVSFTHGDRQLVLGNTPPVRITRR